MPGRACSLHALVCGSHYHHFNKCGYAEVFMPSKCLMQMHNLLLTHASFLPPSTLKLPWDGGRNYTWNSLYLSREGAWTRLYFGADTLPSPFIPWKTSFSSFCLQDALGFPFAWWCHKPCKRRLKCRKGEGCMWVVGLFVFSLLSNWLWQVNKSHICSSICLLNTCLSCFSGRCSLPSWLHPIC